MNGYFCTYTEDKKMSLPNNEKKIHCEPQCELTQAEKLMYAHKDVILQMYPNHNKKQST